MSEKIRKAAEQTKSWFQDLDNDLKLAAAVASMIVFLYTSFALKAEVKAQFDASEQAQTNLRKEIRQDLQEIKESTKATEDRVFQIQMFITKERFK
jgi:uncharacterized protein involved in exopolysaccharide biosynthesis